MNYDGPSFYNKRESKENLNGQEEKVQEIETPLDRLKKEQNRRNQLSKKIDDKQKSRRLEFGNHYFRSKQIPKSLQNRDGWKEETWNQNLIIELQKRLKKEPEDFLLFADNFIEEVVEEETIESNEKKTDDISAEALRIKKMVAEIESTLDTAALVQKEIKPDLKKPNTGLHRTLSNIIAEDKTGLKK